MARMVRSIGQPSQWALARHSFDPETKVFYAYSQQEADELKPKLEAEHGGEFRIFAR